MPAPAGQCQNHGQDCLLLLGSCTVVRTSSLPIPQPLSYFCFLLFPSFSPCVCICSPAGQGDLFGSFFFGRRPCPQSQTSQLGSAEGHLLGEAWPHPGWPCPDGSGREGRGVVPAPLARHTPLHSQALGHFASSRQHPHRVRPLGSTATAKGGPGEAQHKGCSLMRQLAPVKRPDKNKGEGRGSTDGGEEVWPFSLSTLLLISIETCT